MYTFISILNSTHSPARPLIVLPELQYNATKVRSPEIVFGEAAVVVAAAAAVASRD